MEHVITLYLDKYSDGARVDLDGEIVMFGQIHDFHPGCTGLTRFGHFQGPRNLVDQIGRTILKNGGRYRVEKPLCYFDDNGDMVLGARPAPEPVSEPKPKAKLPPKERRALGFKKGRKR